MLTWTETKPHGHSTPAHDDYGCGNVAEFSRLRYFHGQPLSALDLRREQAYHLDKARLRNRLLHGWGVVCGLEVETVPDQRKDPCEGEPGAPVVVVSPGAAIDCRGREIVVRRPRRIAIAELLSKSPLAALSEQHGMVSLTLCYAERPIEPQRPHLAANCEPIADCEHGRVLETYRICASTTRPDPGPPC